MGRIGDLARAGLRDELIAFYREMQQAIPTSEIPPEVLATLQAPESSQTGMGGGKPQRR